MGSDHASLGNLRICLAKNSVNRPGNSTPSRAWSPKYCTIVTLLRDLALTPALTDGELSLD